MSEEDPMKDVLIWGTLAAIVTIATGPIGPVIVAAGKVAWDKAKDSTT